MSLHYKLPAKMDLPIPDEADKLVMEIVVDVFNTSLPRVNKLISLLNNSHRTQMEAAAEERERTPTEFMSPKVYTLINAYLGCRTNLITFNNTENG